MAVRGGCWEGPRIVQSAARRPGPLERVQPWLRPAIRCRTLPHSNRHPSIPAGHGLDRHSNPHRPAWCAGCGRQHEPRTAPGQPYARRSWPFRLACRTPASRQESAMPTTPARESVTSMRDGEVCGSSVQLKCCIGRAQLWSRIHTGSAPVGKPGMHSLRDKRTTSIWTTWCNPCAA